MSTLAFPRGVWRWLALLLPLLCGWLACAPAQAQTTLVNTGLPVVQIWTEGRSPVSSRETYLTGSMKITDGSVTRYAAGLYDGTLQIRGRGNSTWDMPKKGYRLKLAAKAQILDMPADDDWVLLANYADKTLMRNMVAFELSRRFGMRYTPRMRYVELYLNGEHQGNYLLGEHLKAGTHRINVTRLAATDVSVPAISGGYIAELDYLEYTDPGDVYFLTRWQALFNMKEPSGSKITATQLAWFKHYIQATEDVLHSNFLADPVNGYAKYLDVDTVVDWFLINEIFKNQDAQWGSSIYFHKERGEKLRMGPVWDFDLGAGNYAYSDARYSTGWWVRDADWIYQMWSDPAFRAKVKARWKALKKAHIDTLPAYIDSTARLLDASQKRNFVRWPILGYRVWPNAVAMGSYPGEVVFLKEWLKSRIKWLDGRINQL